MAKGTRIHNVADQFFVPHDNPPLFPSAASAASPPLFPSAAALAVSANDGLRPVHEAPLKESCSHPGGVPPGVGCLWCWHVAAAGDGGLSMPRLQDFLPQPLAAALGMERSEQDYLDVEGAESFPAVSAEWSALSAKGLLCSRAQLFFDVWNASGSKLWGQAAAGKIIVVRRGAHAFETITRNAETSGAAAVVILDDREEWNDDIEMGLESKRSPPRIPAILVPKRAESVLTGSDKRFAVIVRR